jgi:hypothetical protein
MFQLVTHSPAQARRSTFLANLPPAGQQHRGVQPEGMVNGYGRRNAVPPDGLKVKDH